MFIFPSNTGVTGYAINSAALSNGTSGYWSYTPAAVSDRTKLVISAWVTKNKNGALQVIYSSYDGVNTTERLEFDSTDAIRVQLTAVGYTYLTDAVFRDTSPYHIVLIVNTAEAVTTDRIKLYVNGVLQTFTTPVNIPLNATLVSGGNHDHAFGAYTVASNFIDAYYAETVFGLEVTATVGDFGEFNSGRWDPISVEDFGVGVAGSYLMFEDGALGTDSSGNGNNWTVNGTITAVTNTPTDVVATFNPLTTTAGSYAQGNLQFTTATNALSTASTLVLQEGSKHQWQVDVNASSAIYTGVSNRDFPNTVNPASSTGYWIYRLDTDRSYDEGSVSGAAIIGTTPTNGDVVDFRVDRDAGTMEVRLNNGSWFTAISGLPTTGLMFVTSGSNNTSTTQSVHTFDDNDFTHALSSGFTALKVVNLTQTAITSGTVSTAGDFQYTGGEPSSISGVTVDEIFALGFTSTNTGAWTCTVSDPIGGDVMPRGVAN